MAATCGYVHAWKGGVLYRRLPVSLRCQAGPDDWSAVLGMWAWGSHVYILSNEICCRVDPETVSGHAIDLAAGKPMEPPN